MSSILKALKRLEEEKAARDAAAAGISARVKSGVVVPRPPSPWRLPLALGVVAALAVFITYAVMGGFGPGRRTVTQSAVVAPQQPQQSSQPVASEPSPAPVSRPLQGVKTPPAQSPAAPAVARTATPPVISAPAARDHGATFTTEPPAEVQVTPAVAPAAPSVSTGPALPDLKVSGIAWQKDASSRMAMVNGATVVGGGKVSGARVEEIFPDRVRFSFEGKSFDVFLGKSSSDR
ncbi:MAG TPA: general secretion pathway protein GspB [Geobacteraceae bacterium]